jgi:hypothetical protein
MQPHAPVRLREVRDFGQIITTTFQFLKQNKGPLFRVIGTVCLPTAILAGFLLGKSVGDIQSMAFSMPRAGDPDTVLGKLMGGMLPMALGYLLLVAAFVGLIAVVNEYLRAYNLGEHQTISNGDLWKRALGQSGVYFGTGFLSMLLIGLGFMLCILPGFYPLTIFALVFVCHAIERTGVTGSMARSNQLVKGRFWETLGLVVVVGLINSVIGYALMLPFTIAGAIIGFNMLTGLMEDGSGYPDWYSSFMAAQFSYQMAVSMLTYPIVTVAIGLKYFSLVEEKESAGLRERIQGFEQA